MLSAHGDIELSHLEAEDNPPQMGLTMKKIAAAFLCGCNKLRRLNDRALDVNPRPHPKSWQDAADRSRSPQCGHARPFIASVFWYGILISRIASNRLIHRVMASFVFQLGSNVMLTFAKHSSNQSARLSSTTASVERNTVL